MVQVSVHGGLVIRGARPHDAGSFAKRLVVLVRNLVVEMFLQAPAWVQL